MQATLEPIGLAGGSVQGTVTVALKGGASRNSAGMPRETPLDLSLITKAAFAEPEPRVIGRGGFTTGNWSGQGRDVMAESERYSSFRHSRWPIHQVSAT